MFNITLALISILRSTINDILSKFHSLTKVWSLLINIVSLRINKITLIFIKLLSFAIKASNGANIRNRYNQVPHLTQDTNGKDLETNSQFDTTNESQEVSPFPAGDYKAHINRRSQRHSKNKTEKKHKKHIDINITN